MFASPAFEDKSTQKMNLLTIIVIPGNQSGIFEMSAIF